MYIHLLITSILIHVLIFMVQAIRKFIDEYPNITVCESTLSNHKGVYHMPTSYEYLKGHFSAIHKCTHIEGDLIIENIWEGDKKLDFSILENIEEVSGMVKIRNNSIGHVILPKLKVIRGENSMSFMWKNKQRQNASLYLQINQRQKSEHIILPNLRVISKHSVYFRSSVSHTYLPHSIRWKEFFENESQQSLLTLSKPNNFYKCHSSCELKRPNSTKAYCWSDLLSHCQQKTNCINLKDSHQTKWCYFTTYNNKTHEAYCGESCVGGCTGIKNNKCQVCKTYMNGEYCVDGCPPEYITKMGKIKKNPDFKLRVGMFCASTCPENLLRQEDACIFTCTSPQFYRVNQRCVPSKDNVIPKVCRIEEECENINSSSIYITKTILERLTFCEELIGQFHLTNASFDPFDGNVTVSLLYKHLKNVKFITGNIVINGQSARLHNLTFLQNLEEIRHVKQKDCFEPGDTALNIFYTDLEFLGLRRLRNIHGQFYEGSNKHLCYLDTLPWEREIIKNHEFRSDKKHCNKSCDPQCGHEGCWGPSSSMCYKCIGVRAGYNCVSKCEDEPGFYTNNDFLQLNYSVSESYDNGTCKPCHKLCKDNCTGPTPKDCFSECRFFKENNECVLKCSKDFYADGKNCLPCNKNCLSANNNESTCTGGADYLGKGGCNICKGFILKNYSVSCYHQKCPKEFFLMKKSKSSHPLCTPCTEPCSECVSNSVSKPDCSKCKGFWKDDVCVEICEGDKPIQNQSNTNEDKCFVCDQQCIGCYFPNNASQCITCKNKKLYTNYKLNKFTCIEMCPISHTHLHKSNNVDVCVTIQESQEYEENERYKKHMNVFLWILGPTIVACVSASIIICQLFLKIRKKKSTNHLRAVFSNIHEPDSRILLFNKESILAQPNMNRLQLIPTTNIIFDINGKPLGTGAFGSVYKGIWKLYNDSSLKKENNELEVAVKVIQVINQKAMEELMAEAKVMASVSHKHCLRLIGICLFQKQPCLITTFLKLGSLDKYLRKHKDSLSSYTLLSWAEQIANGMTYLEMRGIIHRDLATRNVLLNSSHVLQITDFGLSRILEGTEQNHEIIVTSGQVPIRWLAPETLSSGIYSHKTDVWAYGVTLWEIFTFGERPYEGMQVREIPEFLSQNNRLPQPEICSLDTYVEMLNCWKSPQFRSSFEELMLKFLSFSQHPTYYLNIPNDACLINEQTSPYRQSISYSENHFSFTDSKTPLWKGMYKGQPSLDGTIMTCLDDYADTESHSKVRRQSSNLSTLSSNAAFSYNRDGLSPLLFQSIKLSETTEEDDEYLEPRRAKVDDDEYLEPMIKRME